MKDQTTITAADIVYISGPMTGIRDANRAAFRAAEYEVKKRFGCRVLNPAAAMPDGLKYTEYITHALLLLCHATAVVLLPGHEKSLGSAIEKECASRDGIKMFVLEEPQQEDEKK